MFTHGSHKAEIQMAFDDDKDNKDNGILLLYCPECKKVWYSAFSLVSKGRGFVPITRNRRIPINLESVTASAEKIFPDAFTEY